MSAAGKAKQEQVIYTLREPARAVYLNVVKASQYEKNGVKLGKPKFDITLALPPDSADLVTIKDLCIAAAKQINPGKKLVTRRLTQEEMDDGGTVEVHMPWKDGTKDADKAKAADKDREFMRGFVIVKASSQFPVSLSGIENGKFVVYSNPDMRPNLDATFYRGCYVGVSVALNPYRPIKDGDVGGVSLYLNSVCFVKNGERLEGSRDNSAETFAHYAGAVSSVDPTAGAGDEL